jgi:DNA-binding transcriptional ArsR family regulator
VLGSSRATANDLDRLFHALADPARRAVVERLSRGPAAVSELARPLPMSLPAVMQHLGVLELARVGGSERLKVTIRVVLPPFGASLKV